MTETNVATRTDLLSTADALARFRHEQGLTDGCDNASSWTVKLGPTVLHLPNFRWRRHAIVAHDLHHLITGHPCTLHGECLVAAWEFGAGRFPHPAATAFCLPLVLMGSIWSPVETWHSFRAGRGTRSLHVEPLGEWVWETRLDELRQRLKRQNTGRGKDTLAFAFILAWAAGILLLPVLGALALVVAIA